MLRVVGVIQRSNRVIMRSSGGGMGLAMMTGVVITRSMGSSGFEMILSVIVVICSSIRMFASKACMMLGHVMTMRAISECMGSVVVSITGLSVSMSSASVSRCCSQVGSCSQSMTARIFSFTVRGTRIATRAPSIMHGYVVNTRLSVVIGGAIAVCICLISMCSLAFGIL